MLDRQKWARKFMDAAVKLDLPTVIDYRVPGVVREFHTPDDADDMRAIDLEIYESPPIPADWPLGIIKPNRIRINGVECVTPEDMPVRVMGLVDKKHPLTATITLFVRSLKVHAEPR